MLGGHRLLAILLAVCIALQLVGWDSAKRQETSPEWVANHLLAKKEQAVNQREREQFLSVIDRENAFYFQEQKRWFVDAIQFFDKNSYHLELFAVTPEQDQQFRVDVNQSYRKNGETYTVQVPVRMRHTPQGWKESDLDFRQLTHQSLKVLYTVPELEEEAYVALDTLKRAIYVMKQRLHWEPKQTVVKLYHDPELFRQSVKPSLPAWAGGWNEAKQAIKLVVDKQNPRQFASGIVHELTHQMVSERTNDNAAYWLQEGAAMYYEAHLLPGLREGFWSQKEHKRPMFSLMDLEKMELEKLEGEKAYEYYQSCYQLFAFLVEELGEEKIQQLFAELKQNPYIDQDTHDKRETLNQRTQQAMKKVFHQTDQELNQQWLKYAQ